MQINLPMSPLDFNTHSYTYQLDKKERKLNKQINQASSSALLDPNQVKVQIASLQNSQSISNSNTHKNSNINNNNNKFSIKMK